MTEAEQIAGQLSEAQKRKLETCINAMAEALSLADDIISVNCGIDTPPAWGKALRNVARWRASVSKVLRRAS